MPLALEHAVVGPFDVSSAATLYWQDVPVLLKPVDREEHLSMLSVRIMSGVNRNNHNSKILRVHLSKEDDLLFLHTLEVSEEEFQLLKVEQGILVDFGNFPGKIISLLGKCVASASEDPPRFQAVLVVRGGDSIFKIVETNDFNQLPHITLAFLPGNDPAVKQFLAFRLSEVTSNCEGITKMLQQTQAQKDAVQQQLAAAERALAESREGQEKRDLEWQARSQTREALALQERTRELARLRDQLDSDKSELEKKFGSQLDALHARLAEADADNRALREAKYELDGKVSELSHKLASSQGSVSLLEEETGRLRQQAAAAAREKTETDQALSESRARVLALDEKVAAQKEVIHGHAQRNADLEAATRQLEARCAELKEAHAGAEARAREAAAGVAKGNHIIDKLSNDLRLAKEKLRRKTAIMARQEEEVTARENGLNQALKDTTNLQHQLSLAQDDNAHLKEQIEALRSKLEESKTQLQGNEQMIRWLNNQVNEAQLATGAALSGGSSRYTFRPTVSALGGASSGIAGSVAAMAGPARGRGGREQAPLLSGSAAAAGQGLLDAARVGFRSTATSPSSTGAVPPVPAAASALQSTGAAAASSSLRAPPQLTSLAAADIRSRYSPPAVGSTRAAAQPPQPDGSAPLPAGRNAARGAGGGQAGVPVFAGGGGFMAGQLGTATAAAGSLFGGGKFAVRVGGADVAGRMAGAGAMPRLGLSESDLTYKPGSASLVGLTQS